MVYEIGEERKKMEKELHSKIKIENIDEFNKLLEQFKTIADKVQNFEFKISATQYEHN